MIGSPGIRSGARSGPQVLSVELFRECFGALKYILWLYQVHVIRDIEQLQIVDTAVGISSVHLSKVILFSHLWTPLCTALVRASMHPLAAPWLSFSSW